MLKLLRNPGLTFFMECHSGLSAKIAQEAGQTVRHWSNYILRTCRPNCIISIGLPTDSVEYTK